MDWAGRVKAATGAARGLAYLHEDCKLWPILLVLLRFLLTIMADVCIASYSHILDDYSLTPI